MKTVTVLLGSPRRDANTETLTKAFLEPFDRAGAVINSFRLAEMKISPCTDCRMCWQSGKPCVIDDDMEAIYGSLDQSELILFASPLYWYSWSAQIKPVWDRLIPYNAGNAPRTLKGKQSILISTGADTARGIFNGLAASYEKSCALLGLDRVGEYLYSGMGARGDAAAHAAVLNELREAGERLL